MTSASPPPEPTKIDSFLKRFWWATLGLKLALAAVIPLFADEAYYWVWGQKIDWSYFDHPPMIGWWFALSDLLALPAPLVRWPGVALAHLGLWIWIRLLREYFPELNLRRWLWLYLLCPLTGLAGIAMTPDLPLSLFWATSTFFAFRFWKRGDLGSALGLGISLGAGFLSKYMIVLFPLALLPALFRPEIRRRAFSLPSLVVLLAGALMSLPVLWWNKIHDGLSFSFQLKHGLEPVAWEWSMTGDYLLGVTVVLLPLLPALGRHLFRETRGLLLALTGLTPFLFFTATSLRAPVELNWPMMGLPALLAAASWAGARSLRWGRHYYAALSLFLLLALTLPASVNPLEKAHEASRYEVLTPLVKENRPLFASSYQMASVLWFVSGEPVYKLRGSRRFDMFDLWPESVPTTNFYFAHEKGDRWPAEFPRESATLLRDLGDFELWELRKP